MILSLLTLRLLSVAHKINPTIAIYKFTHLSVLEKSKLFQFQLTKLGLSLPVFNLECADKGSWGWRHLWAVLCTSSGVCGLHYVGLIGLWDFQRFGLLCFGWIAWALVPLKWCGFDWAVFETMPDSREFGGKWREKKIKKLNLNSINYFYMLFQTHFI